MSAAKQPTSEKGKPKPRVLFVCIGNSCRSPMAESIARRDSSQVFDCTSAGLTPLGSVQKETLDTLAGNGYPVENLFSNAINTAEWAAADVIVNMSGYPKQRVFPRSEWNKVEDWNVEDPYGSDPVTYQRIFDDIRTRIELLTARLREGAAKL
jgi:arsenate reductase